MEDTPVKNDFDQPIGFAVPAWRRPPRPGRETLAGRWCSVVPLDPARHVEELWDVYVLDADSRHWTYLPYGPFADLAAYRAWIEATCRGDDPLFFAIVDAASGRAVGLASYLRIDPLVGSIEVGHLRFSRLLQRTPAATEAMYLMMRNAFTLGYRRYEWKCDALNAPSRAAAARLGLSFEGVFRQAWVMKGRNRDTAWYAAIDRDWPALARAFEQWLDPENFDADGRQRTRLTALTAPLLVPPARPSV
jgi:RimJ/RimL family protein N-acetyltransferase